MSAQALFNVIQVSSISVLSLHRNFLILEFDYHN
jgi:hypothetical protein